MDIDGQRAKNGHEEQDGNKPDLDGRLCTVEHVELSEEESKSQLNG